MFLECHDIGHDLARVGAVGKPVDDWHGGVFGHLVQGCFLERADHDHVDIARQHAGRVGNGFAMAQLHIGPRQHHRLPAHLAHTDVKADAGPGRWLFKNQRDHVVCQRLLCIRGAFGQASAGVFHAARIVDDGAQIGSGRGVNVEEMGHSLGFLAGVGPVGFTPPGPPVEFIWQGEIRSWMPLCRAGLRRRRCRRRSGLGAAAGGSRCRRQERSGCRRHSLP